MRSRRAVWLAGALLLAGCGGSERAAVRLIAPRRVTDARSVPDTYRWLVPVTGRAPTVAAENARPGTTAWQLPGGLARGPVEGYVSAQAIAPGQVEKVYVNAPGARSVRVVIYRMGWYGGKGGRAVLAADALPARRQPRCNHLVQTGLTECRWQATLAFRVPAALPSGVYIVRMSTPAGAVRDCMFVVRGSGAPILVEIPTASYEAYNAWGGDSLYPGGQRVGVTGTGQGVEVSYDRPYDSDTGAGQFFARDVAMVRFLERYRYRVQYTTIESIDADPGQVAGRRVLMDIGHSEYWSARDARAFAGARDRGTNLLFISSDTLAWRVRFAPATRASSQAGAADHRIEGYKEHVALDPVRSDPSGVYPGLGASLTGSAYGGCVTPRVRVPGAPVYRYYAWSPSPGLQPRWLFAGSGVGVRTRIPGIVGYEVDGVSPLSPRGARVVGSGRAVCMSGPGLGLGGGVADTTVYTAPSGALVFATGTLGWELGLYPVPVASPDAPRAPDRRVVRMTRNLLGYVLHHRGRAAV